MTFLARLPQRFRIFWSSANPLGVIHALDPFLKTGIMPEPSRPGLVTYTATRWGDLLNPREIPPGESPLKDSDCYRFAMSHPMVDVCITGPKNREQMREALRALELGPLSGEEIARARRIGDPLHAKSRRLVFG